MWKRKKKNRKMCVECNSIDIMHHRQHSTSSSNSSMLNLRCNGAQRSSKTASTLKTADQIYALNILYNINAFSFSIPINGPMLHTSFSWSERSKNALSLLIGIWLTEVVVSSIRCCCVGLLVVFCFECLFYAKNSSETFIRRSSIELVILNVYVCVSVCSMFLFFVCFCWFIAND